MYVCVYVLHECMVHVCVCVSMHVHMRACLSACVRACSVSVWCVRMLVSVRASNVYVCVTIRSTLKH